jgi:hypothetical protein
MEQKTVLIFGSGHLVFRMKKILQSKGISYIHCTDEQINNVSVSGSITDNLRHYFKKLNTDKIEMIYLLDDKDEDNLQLIIALRHLNYPIAVTASLFNENFSADLFNMEGKLTIINPAKIAATEFVKAFYTNMQRPAVTIPAAKYYNPVQKKDSVVLKLVLVLLSLSVASVAYFHYFDQMTWINATYFVVVIITTVGFGDLNLLGSTDLSKIVGIILMLGSSVLIWAIFSLMIDHFFKMRIQLALGRKKYQMKDHIIVCGLGRLGFFIVEELLRRKEKVIIIELEQSEHVDYLKSAGAEVYIGDGRSEKVLTDVNITQSAALISVINNDALNIEIGLHARTLYPNMKIILRIFDEDIAHQIKSMMNIHLALSNSSIASKSFIEVLEKQQHPAGSASIPEK